MSGVLEVNRTDIKLMEKVGSGCTAEVYRGYMVLSPGNMNEIEDQDWRNLWANDGMLINNLAARIPDDKTSNAHYLLQASHVVELFATCGADLSVDLQGVPLANHEYFVRVERIRQHVINVKISGWQVNGFVAEVAIKQIDWNKSSMGHKEQLAFDREVAIMPKISHPNLVAFLGVSSLQRPFRIVSEFCSGGCCFELLHNSDHIDLKWQQQFKMIADIAIAMRYLHAYTPQIIHRDLKSLNLLLAQPVRQESDIPLVKVSDFGLSRMKERAGEDEDGLTWGRMTIAAGTCHWMAPEVYTGSTYDEKVDVYSYAMILFEIICREIPFEEEEPANVGSIVTQGGRPDLEAVPPDTPAELQELMIQCWEHEPEARPNFAQIVESLRRIRSTYMEFKDVHMD